jgi:hypothetical protein
MKKVSKKGRSILIGTVAVIIHCALYLALTEDVDPRELVAMLLTGAVATTAALVFASAANVHFHLNMRDVMQFWYMPWYAISGTGEIMHALAKQLFTRAGAPSFLAAVHFEMGSEKNIEDAGRRALAITYTTATPNFIVLGLVKKQNLMIYHQLIPGEVLTITRKLGARP